MPKASDFIIGIILISFTITVLGTFMSNLNENYNVPYDESNLAAYDQLSAMSNLTRELEAGSEIEEKTGVIDIIGGYFTDAYNVLLLTKTSFNTFDTMSNDAIDQADLGETGRLLRIVVSAVVLVLMVLAVIISAIVKKDL